MLHTLRIGKYVDQVNVEIEESEAIADLLDVLDEFPECGTDNISETARRWVLPWRNARYRSTTGTGRDHFDFERDETPSHTPRLSPKQPLRVLTVSIWHYQYSGQLLADN
jgi:hypothetical protein